MKQLLLVVLVPLLLFSSCSTNNGQHAKELIDAFLTDLKNENLDDALNNVHPRIKEENGTTLKDELTSEVESLGTIKSFEVISTNFSGSKDPIAIELHTIIYKIYGSENDQMARISLSKIDSEELKIIDFQFDDQLEIDEKNDK